MSYGKITHVDIEKREIEGIIRFEQVIPGAILRGAIFSYEASKKIFSLWYERGGSVLEMYDTANRIGKCIDVTFNDEQKQAAIRIHVSKGVEGTLEKVANGTLTEIGLTYRPLAIETIKRNGEEYDYLTEYDLLSLSLVELSPYEMGKVSVSED